ncbi:hypothetical protein FQN51_004086 [Onygenales sp. PD_10]|nr:hypothetical protein FQN51_004086 [Onygenales sp. PD_10]
MSSSSAQIKLEPLSTPSVQFKIKLLLPGSIWVKSKPISTSSVYVKFKPLSLPFIHIKSEPLSLPSIHIKSELLSPQLLNDIPHYHQHNPLVDYPAHPLEQPSQLWVPLVQHAKLTIQAVLHSCRLTVEMTHQALYHALNLVMQAFLINANAHLSALVHYCKLHGLNEHNLQPMG